MTNAKGNEITVRDFVIARNIHGGLAIGAVTGFRNDGKHLNVSGDPFPILGSKCLKAEEAYDTAMTSDEVVAETKRREEAAKAASAPSPTTA